MQIRLCAFEKRTNIPVTQHVYVYQTKVFDTVVFWRMKNV